MRVFVAGFESSGNRWIRSVLSQHHGLMIFGDSFPSGRLADRHYPVMPSGMDCMVIAVRDQHCRRKSIETNQYNKDRESDFYEDLTLQKLFDAAAGLRLVFISYEAAITFKERYWENVFHQIGVESVVVNTEYIDGNAKYFGKE